MRADKDNKLTTPSQIIMVQRENILLFHSPLICDVSVVPLWRLCRLRR